MAEETYQNDDFIYVDPDEKVIVGHVEWDKSGNAIPKEWPYPPEKDGSTKKRKKRYYPWGSYRSMRKMYKLKGVKKDKEPDDYISLEQAIDKLQKEPYWD